MKIAPVNLTWTTARSAADVRTWVTTSVVDTLVSAGYRIDTDTSEELVMTHRGPSWWPMLLVSEIAFWLSDDRGYQVVFKFLTTVDGGTRMFVIGEMPTRIATVLRELTTG